MNLLGFLKLLFTFANKLATYLHERQLLDAGQAKQLSADLMETLNAIQRSKDAKSAVMHDPDSVRSDPDNRDNRP